jgi:hypothetical protein
LRGNVLFVAQEGGGGMSGHVRHESGLQGTLCMAFHQGNATHGGGKNEPKSADAHGVRIWGDDGRCMEWAFEVCEVRVLPGPASGAQVRAVQTEGDGWVNGGVKDSLDDCLRECAVALGIVQRGAGMRRHMGSPEDAIRDAAVVWALLSSSRTCGSDPEMNAGAWVSPLQVLYDSCGQHASPWCKQPAGRACLFNALGSRSHVPPRKVLCFSTRDAQHVLPLLSSPRAVGADQSWSRCGETKGARVDMRRLSRVVSVETVRDETADFVVVRVEAGCSLRELTAALKARGLCIASLPVLLDQTVAGAVSTGSHGSSIRHGTLSDAVHALTVVDKSGNVHQLHGNGDSVRGLRMARGLLGVITEVQLRVSPAYFVRSEVRALSWDGIAGVELAAEHVWVHVRLGATDEDGAAAVALCLHRAQEEDAEARAYDGCNWPFPHALPPMPPSSAQAPPLEGTEGTWLSMQYAVPVERTRELVDVLRGLGEHHPGMRGRLVELKFIQGSNCTLMGPNAERPGGCEHGQDVVCCNLWWRR